MTTRDRPSPSGSRTAYWVVGCVLVGWLIVYNGMRLAGSSPADAAWISLGIGAVVGLAAFGVGVLVTRRLAASGRVLHRGPAEIPSPSELEPAQADAIRLAWPALAALAAVALAVGAYLAADWVATDPGDRATATIILGAWNILAGLWIGDEALRMRRGEAEGVESLVLGCGLTAILAGIGLSRDLAEPAQVALIVLAGIGGVLSGLVVWRLQGARGVPYGAIASVLVAALALILPTTL